MARVGLRKVVFGLAATGLLIGCVDGGGRVGGDGTQVSAPARAANATRDVEAPEIFQTNDSALWDGRPSLGGIWVAAPDAVNPERVAIFNPATGKTITGALFRRERDNPGPRLQLSSDAAEALGILAGKPTQIRVTALRKEVVQDAAPAEDAAVASATDPAAPGASADADSAAIASAALDAVEARTTEAAPAEAAPADGSAGLSGAAVAAAAVAAEGVEAIAPDAAPQKKTWRERRAEARAEREAKRRAAAEARAAAAAAAAGTGAIEGEAPTTSPDAAAAALAPIESAPLDARGPDPAEPASPARQTVGGTAAPAAKPAAEAPAEPAAATGPARPIQVASFSKEDNANRAAEALAKIGVTATPQKSDANGKVVWGVVVMGDDVMLKKIKDAGFADAFYLR